MTPRHTDRRLIDDLLSFGKIQKRMSTASTTRPARMLREAPPSRDEATTSFTCDDSVEVNTLTNSGSDGFFTSPSGWKISPSLISRSTSMTAFEPRLASSISLAMISLETLIGKIPFLKQLL